MEGAKDLGIFTTDADLRVRVWDDWIAAVTGVAADLARGRHVTELIPDLAARGLLARFEDVVTAGAVHVLAPAFHHYLLKCPPRLSSARFTEMQQRVTLGPLREEDKVVGVMVAVEDVTPRLDAERDLALALQSTDLEVRREAARSIEAGAEPLSADGLRAALGHDDWRVRRVGVKGLAAAADPALVDRLIDALREQHRDFGVLSSALKLLAIIDVDVTAPLTALIQHHDPDLRIQAALALGDQRHPAAVDALLQALQDADANVRFHAVESLGRLGAAAAIDPLLTIVESKDFFLSFAAIDALALIGDAGVVSRLVPLLPDPVLQVPIVDALGVLGDDDVVPSLIDLVNRSPAIAGAVAHAIASIHRRSEDQYGTGVVVAELVRAGVTEAGAHHLMDALPSAEGERLPSLVRLLGWVRVSGVDRALVRLLNNPVVRSDVVESLVRQGSGVIAQLSAVLDDDDPATRVAAVEALGRVGDRAATPALVAALDQDVTVVVAAAGALARLGDGAAFEPLLKLIAHRDASVRQAVIGALNSIGHPLMPARIAELLTSDDHFVRESAVRIAGYFGYPETAAALLERARDPVEAVRKAALEHLPFLDDRRVTPALISALHEDTAPARAAAARALSRVEDGAGAAALRDALTDRDGWVRYYAARSLASLRDADSADALLRLAASDPLPHVRIAAIEAVAAIDGADVLPQLQQWCDAADRDVAAAALEAVGRLADAAGLRPLEEALKSDEPARRIAALRALIAHGSSGAVAALEWTAAADAEPAVVRLAMDGLRQVAAAAGTGRDAAVDALVALLADADRRRLAVGLLGELPAGCIARTALGLTAGSPVIRRATVDALSRFRDREATRLIASALGDEAAEVREAAVAAIMRTGAADMSGSLEALSLRDPSAAVRRSATSALLRLTGRRPELRG
jgi:HEAT repeat protein